MRVKFAKMHFCFCAIKIHKRILLSFSPHSVTKHLVLSGTTVFIDMNTATEVNPRVEVRVCMSNYGNVMAFTLEVCMFGRYRLLCWNGMGAWMINRHEHKCGWKRNFYCTIGRLGCCWVYHTTILTPSEQYFHTMWEHMFWCCDNPAKYGRTILFWSSCPGQLCLVYAGCPWRYKSSRNTPKNTLCKG